MNSILDNRPSKRILSVSQLTGSVRTLIEKTYPLVWVTGERLLSFVGIGMIILMSTFGTGGGSMTNDVPLNE